MISYDALLSDGKTQRSLENERKHIFQCRYRKKLSRVNPVKVMQQKLMIDILEITTDEKDEFETS